MPALSGVSLAPPPPSFPATRAALHRLAVYVISPARRTATGRIGLRPSLDGFGTPAFIAADGAATQVRVEGGCLVVEADGSRRGIDLVGGDGVSLAAAGAFVGVEPDVGAVEQFDVPEPGSLDEPLEVDRAAALALGAWYGWTGAALQAERASAGVDAGASPPSDVQLWPEHFDLAFDAGHEAAGARANFGASPGDAGIAEPYLYVGPWNRDGLDDVGFWNAAFGAVLPLAELLAAPDAWDAAAGFFAEGRDRLRSR